MKKQKTFNLYSISEARNVLFGIATLWIGLFHSDFLSLERYTENQFLIDSFRFFRGLGNVGVDMFLFLSGIGLYFSFSKDSRVLMFWKKRLMRVLPTAFLIATVYFSFRFTTGRYTSGLSHYLSRMSFTYFFIGGERVFWFISLILVLYLIFPIFYKIIERFRLGGMLGLVVLAVGFTFLLRFTAPGIYNNIEIALCRVPGFIIGIWAGRFVMEKKEINKNWLWAFLAVAVGMMVLMYNYTAIVKGFVPDYSKKLETMYIFIYRYEGTILSIALVVLDSYIITALRRRGQCNLLRNFFEFVGMYSMEYYMIYLNINHYLERIYDVSEGHYVMMYFGSFVVSLVLCVAARKVCDFFMAYMQRRPKGMEDAGSKSDKWYGFLTYTGLYLAAIFNAYLSVMYFVEGHFMLGIALCGAAALSVLTRFMLAGHKSLGPILLYILIAADPLIWLVRKMLRSDLLHTVMAGGKKAMLGTGLVVILTAAVIALNVIYFNKRKELFKS